jgi:hypothetical protein
MADGKRDSTGEDALSRPQEDLALEDKGWLYRHEAKLERVYRNVDV